MLAFAVPVVCTLSQPPRLPVCRQKRPYGYWKDPDNLAEELRAFAAANNDPGRMPTNAELLAAGRSDIAAATRRNGTWSSAAKKAGLTLTSIARPRSLYLSFCTQITSARPNNYWRNFMNLQRELQQYIFGGKLPSAQQLENEGRSDLIRAIGLHGGFSAVADRMDLRAHYRTARYWRNFDNVKRDLNAFIKVHGVEGIMPPVALLRDKGPPGLLAAIVRIHGGSTAVAKRMGLRCLHPRRPHGYWKCSANRTYELRAFVRELCEHNPKRDPLLMPSFDECVEWNRQDLAAGLARNEGFTVAARLAGFKARNARGETPGSVQDSVNFYQ